MDFSLLEFSLPQDHKALHKPQLAKFFDQVFLSYLKEWVRVISFVPPMRKPRRREVNTPLPTNPIESIPWLLRAMQRILGDLPRQPSARISDSHHRGGMRDDLHQCSSSSQSWAGLLPSVQTAPVHCSHCSPPKPEPGGRTRREIKPRPWNHHHQLLIEVIHLFGENKSLWGGCYHSLLTAWRLPCLFHSSFLCASSTGNIKTNSKSRVSADWWS